jgi:hypothetical protein
LPHDAFSRQVPFVTSFYKISTSAMTNPSSLLSQPPISPNKHQSLNTTMAPPNQAALLTDSGARDGDAVDGEPRDPRDIM